MHPTLSGDRDPRTFSRTTPKRSELAALGKTARARERGRERVREVKLESIRNTEGQGMMDASPESSVLRPSLRLCSDIWVYSRVLRGFAGSGSRLCALFFDPRLLPRAAAGAKLQFDCGSSCEADGRCWPN